MRVVALFTLSVLLFLSPHAFGGTDWPEFRGPTGQGHSDSNQLPVRWSPSENIVWTVEVPGAGLSSPVIYQDSIYLTTAMLDDSGNPTSLRLLAISSASGKLLWNRAVFEVEGRQSKHQKNSHASPTPVAEDDRIYVHFGPNGTAALGLDGEVIWKQEGLNYPPVHGNGGSPIIVADKLIFSCDGGSDPFIVALNKSDGTIAWKVPRVTDADRTFSFSTPLLIHVDGMPQVISPGSAMVGAYDPVDGSEIWRVNYDQGYSVVPRPVLGHGMVYLSTSFDRPVVFAIKIDGKGDVTDSHVAWRISRSAPNTPSMLLVGDEVYFVSDNGIASCADARTGDVHWNERLGGDFSASPVYANGMIYFTNERGKTFVVKASKQFEVIAENDLKEVTLASLAISGPSIFQRTEKHLFRIQQPTE